MAGNYLPRMFNKYAVFLSRFSQTFSPTVKEEDQSQPPRRQHIVTGGLEKKKNRQKAPHKRNLLGENW
jgi:hypothetical protein